MRGQINIQLMVGIVTVAIVAMLIGVVVMSLSTTMSLNEAMDTLRHHGYTAYADVEGNLHLTGKLTQDSGITDNDFLRRDGSEAMTGDLAMGTHRITGLAGPSLSSDAATKGYVDSTGFSIFDRFIHMVTWGSLDGFTTGGVGTPTLEPRGSTLLLQTSGATNDSASVRTTTQWYTINEVGKEVAVEFILFSMVFGTDQNIWFRLNQSGSLSETDDHFGFKIIGTDLYASNGDGTTQKITDTGVDLSTGSQLTRLRAVLLPGTNCKFYVNDVLKVTHTENLPDYASLEIKIQIETLTDMARAIEIGRVLVEKEY